MSALTLTELAEPFELCIWITGDASRVRDAWCSSEEIQKWFLARAENRDALGAITDEAKREGRFEWEWIEGSTDRGTYLRVENDLLEFGWYEDGGRVLVTWEQDGGEVMVKLRQEMHEGDLEKRAMIQHGCHLGWTFFLTNLKAWIEAGIDLREKNMAHKRALNV